MRPHLGCTLAGILILSSGGVSSTDLNHNCIDCGGVKPSIEKRPDKPFNIYADRYCDRFHSADKDSLDMLFDDMDASPYPDVYRYLSTPTCQPRAYGNDNKIPIIHLIADDPDKRLKFLEITYTYFEFYKRTEQFTALLNSKSKPMNETFLDYIETLNRKNYHKTPALQAELKEIKRYACAHGAVYSLYKDKKCPE